MAMRRHSRLAVRRCSSLMRVGHPSTRYSHPPSRCPVIGRPLFATLNESEPLERSFIENHMASRSHMKGLCFNLY